MSSTNNIPPGWHPDPANPSGGMRWWDGTQWTEQVQPVPNQPPPPPSLPGSTAAGGYPTAGQPGSYPVGGPMGGPFGRNRGRRMGGGPFGSYPSSVGGSFWSRNRHSVTAIVISAIYVAIALATGFVLLGIVPLFASIRAVRFREQLAPLAVIAAIVTIVVSVSAIASR